MTDPEEIVVVAEVQRLHLEPGDVLIYVYPRKLTAQTVDMIRHRLREAFKADIPIVILDQGARLQVVNKNELENA